MPQYIVILLAGQRESNIVNSICPNFDISLHIRSPFQLFDMDQQGEEQQEEEQVSRQRVRRLIDVIIKGIEMIRNISPTITIKKEGIVEKDSASSESDRQSKTTKKMR